MLPCNAQVDDGSLRYILFYLFTTLCTQVHTYLGMYLRAAYGSNWRYLRGLSIHVGVTRHLPRLSRLLRAVPSMEG